MITELKDALTVNSEVVEMQVPRKVHLRSDRRTTIVYTDGAVEGENLTCGGMISAGATTFVLHVRDS